MVSVSVSSVVPMTSSAVFPAAAPSVLSQAERRNEETPRDHPPAWFCPNEVRILILDDDESICRMIQSALDCSTFKVDTVSNPMQAADVLKARYYHVIILDYVLPGLETEQVLDWLRETQPEASIIVVTAYPSIDSALSCLRARTYDYLTKPFQVAHLQRVVNRCLEGRGLLRLSEEALRESLGAIIRERRKGLGLTLAQMAQRTGVSLGYLSQIELGKNSASIETLYRISLGLGIKMADLFHSVQKT
ncbi:MAG TPA: response regulator [Gemmataceae bacterium]|nr:response regulator [Gemmataceae bacterium]